MILLGIHGMRELQQYCLLFIACVVHDLDCPEVSAFALGFWEVIYAMFARVCLFRERGWPH